MPHTTINAAILGARAYTARELVRICYRHPSIKIAHLQARVDKPEPLSNTFPEFLGLDLPDVAPMDPEGLPGDVQVAFLCLPHGAAASNARKLAEKGIRIIDLSADFRFRDHKTYEAAYGDVHPAQDLNYRAVYGLPEINRAMISGATLVACPGCYPTSIILAFAPLMKRDMIDVKTLLADSKSGISGAGRTPNDTTHYCSRNENVEAYKVADHRHVPEIEEQLSRLAGAKSQLTFVPHLMPMERGIHSTCYATLKEPIEEENLQNLYRQFYRNDPFVRVCPGRALPSTAAVSRTNFCDIAVRVDQRSQRLIVLSTIDNLVKGASGQAIQCFNICFGFRETDGLL